MKHSLPLMAALAASTLAAPVMAQDMSRFMNLSDLASDRGLSEHAALALASTGYSLNTPRAAMPNIEAIVALAPEVSLLAPSRSMAPLPRRTITQVVTPTHEAPMADVMAEARASAPLGANVAVVSGANTAVIAGTNTAVIQSSPDVASAPRVTLWQRIFGL